MAKVKMKLKNKNGKRRVEPVLVVSKKEAEELGITTPKTVIPLRDPLFMSYTKQMEITGHLMRPETTESGGMEGIHLRCSKCLGHAFFTASGLPIRDTRGDYIGTCLSYGCDPNMLDKTIEFSHEPMSEEHRARVNRPWKAPSEKDASK